MSLTGVMCRFTQVFCLVLLTGFSLVAFANADEAEKEAEKSEVFIKVLEEQEIYDPLVFGGFIASKDARSVGAELSGTVKRVVVDLGQKVSKGQVLFSIRPTGAGLDYNTNIVRSPIDGIITRISHDPGELVQAGEGVLTVANGDELELTVQVTYSDIFMLKRGELTDIKVAGGRDREDKVVEGEVVSLSPSADPKLGTFPVKLKLRCSLSPKVCKEYFLLGTFARATFKKNLRKGIRVSAKQLISQRKKAVVIDKDGNAKHVPVKLGAFLGRDVEILEGLKPGMKFVTSFSKFPKEGEPVLVKTKEEVEKSIYSKSPKDDKENRKS